MSLNGINGASPVSTGTKLPSKPVAHAEAPQVSERSRKIQEWCEQQVNGLDAFVEAGQDTMDAVVARLQSAPGAPTDVEMLKSAFRAMRSYAVVTMLKPKEDRKITEDLKLFCRLWSAAEKTEKREGEPVSTHSKVNLDFGLGFNALIQSINTPPDVTVIARK